MASVEAEDWRVGLSLLQRQRCMLEGQYGADVKFVVGDGNLKQTVMAHKFILVSASAIFEEMMNSEAGAELDPISVTIMPQAFWEMLRFIYYEEVTVTADNVIALRHLSRQYGITQLTEKCAIFLRTVSSAEAVCCIWDKSVEYNDHVIAKQCFSFIAKHPHDILTAPNFVKISHRSLVEMIQSDELDVDESAILNGCIQWADVKCLTEGKELNGSNRRLVLGGAIFQIRFPIMTAVEFTRSTHTSSLLTSSERASIQDHIILHGSRTTLCDCHIQFNTKTRRRDGGRSRDLCGAVDEQPRQSPLIVQRFRSIANNVLAAGQDFLDVTCDKAAMLEAVGLYGGINAGHHEVKVQVIDSNGHVISDTGMVIMESDGSRRPVRVDLPRPVQLMAGVRYSLAVTMSGYMSTYIGDGGQSVVRAGPFQIKFHSLSRLFLFRKSCRQIPELYFHV